MSDTLDALETYQIKKKEKRLVTTMIKNKKIRDQIYQFFLFFPQEKKWTN